MAKKYIVDLSKDEKAELVSLTQKGRPGARKSSEQTFCFWLTLGNPILELLNFYIQVG